jgi:cell wall-associated NlpC family hydrolase
MKTNPRLKSFLLSSIVLFILFGVNLCSPSNALAENTKASISRSGLDRSEIRETIAAIEAEKQKKQNEYDIIYNEVVKAEEERISDPKSKQSRLVKYAKSLVGTPYWYGGSTPRAFDCSGFVKHVVKKVLKKDIRHSATSQMQLGPRVKDPLPGDLVGFGYGNHFGHIGIYVGNGKVIDALNPNSDTEVRSLSWMEVYVGPAVFVRIIEPNNKFNPHKITQEIIDSKIELSFNP